MFDNHFTREISVIMVCIDLMKEATSPIGSSLLPNVTISRYAINDIYT